MTTCESKDGKGRTLWDILTGRNKRDFTPLELQYHNPLAARVGTIISFDCYHELNDINFSVEKIGIYETKIQSRKFVHTDYYLKATLEDSDIPLRYRLRLTPDEDETNNLGSKIQLFSLFDEMEWNEDFYNNVLGCSEGIFDINRDRNNNELDPPNRYWRVGDILDPYHARVTLLADTNGNGIVEENELERIDVTYWDYSRNTKETDNIPFVETLFVEMGDKTNFFTLLIGREISAFQITVI